MSTFYTHAIAILISLPLTSSSKEKSIATSQSSSHRGNSEITKANLPSILLRTNVSSEFKISNASSLETHTSITHDKDT